MAFDGSEGEQISLSEGATLTSNYRNSNPNGRLGHFIGKDILNAILAQTGCKGIRIYYGIDSSGKQELILVGADANQNDQVSGIIADRSLPCPANCSNQNALNS